MSVTSAPQLQQSGGGGSGISTWGGNAVATGGVNGSVGVGGLAASGAGKAGNPVQIGGVFNTTQPTVTNGQAVEQQMSARGGQIVATGTDAFNVTVNSALPAGGNTVGAVSNTAFGVSAGTANIGMVRVIPSSCTQSTNFANSTVGVATGAGTTVTTTTTCVTFAYANNITNSAVTLRLADRQGSPVIWFGGNADFSIPANSNVRIPVDGVLFTSGITAIAGTASAINLQINGLQ